MKTALKIIMAMIVITVSGVALLILVLYRLNNNVGIDTELEKSTFLSQKPPVLTETLTVKIVTFNIQDLWVVSANRLQRMKHIARVLTDLDPDIVGFQESFIEQDRSVLLNALKSSRLHHHQYYSSGVGGSGLMICSAWPIREVFFRRFNDSGPAHRIWEGDFWAGKGVALARIETPAGILDFYNTHAQAGYGRAAYREVRCSQMRELAAFMNASRTGVSPAFLVGDMNCSIGNADYETVINDAALKRMMVQDSRIDHIFAANSEHYC
ncbi:MAG: Endonuclease/Exonuclease/phosphatase family protein [Candidatus Hydrogenedentes bacterium ADurb.Bin179]|nr:MAG: Endonuclease/Exonuclease/phosphatase family protein [Candidatus Hydrogenedentes bacterium ADurb.Bin179]